MNYASLSDNAARQVIDSMTIFTEYQRVKAQAQQYAGAMYAVIAVSGRMALMRTIAPASFVEFKRWLAEKAPHREEAKRRRDRLQADIVQELLDQKLLVA